jgi:O-antigen/teichoic acid export membrane protein
MSMIRASAIYALANFASAGVPFLLLPLLTRVLDPADYALIVVFGMLMTLCGSFAGFSVHAALGVAWFNRPREELPRFVGTALVFAVSSTLAVALLVTAVLAAYPPLGGGLSAGWGAVAALGAGLNVIVQSRLVLWQSQQRPAPYALMQFCASVLNISLSLVAVVVLGWGAAGRNASIVLALLVMAGAAVWFLRRGGEFAPAFDGVHVSTLLMFGLPLMPHALAGVLLGTADRWLVSAQLGSAALGVYGAVAQLGMVMAILADAFGKAFNPWIYGKLSSKDVRDRERAVGAIYAAIPGFLGLATAVGVVIYFAAGLVLGERYVSARHLLPWFMLGGACSGMYLCVSGLYFYLDKLGRLASITTSIAIAGAILSWVLIGAAGVEGAAIGYAATQSLLAVVTLGVAMITFKLPWSKPVLALGLWRRTQ